MYRTILSTVLLALTFLCTQPVRGQENQETQDSPTPHPRWALSTNLLSWATLAPNLGAELYLANRWSLAADASYGMWNYSHRTHTTPTWSVGGELRYWLQTPRWGFRRTHIGLAVRGGEFDDTFFSRGSQGEALLAGITAGYRFCLRGHWYVDAGFGLGYIHTRYDRYLWNSRFGKYEQNGTRTRNLMGLTGLHVSIIYNL
ncbi:DUF3575 domain-containing protein [Bacteroides cellulosilyticus]|uniref:DUF3575 domain-containing protein n=1 Tax=Bacteroides cellulosilyticus TaxID=246787 RepID=UPI0002D404A7|nr:DUF3575 domain-containing protein [Bacteroides cellulosilyticus]MBN9710320.1 DUF3575 domain-containing protein [Bacteroides cellulosilyticus]MDC7304978.1 DUF3575 domain-containing protein [Bacteroides cellulosilyticus DSM 14838]